MASRCPSELVEQFIEDSATMVTPELMLKYGRSASTVKEWRLDLFHRGLLLWWPGIRVHTSEAETEECVTVEGDAMVISDTEIPFHDVKTLGYLVSVAMKFGIKTLIVAGDFLALDSESPFPTEEGVEETTLADDKWSGADVLESLFTWFEYIVLLKGNHEQRGSRKRELGFIQDIRNQWGDLGDLDISMYKWCLLESGKETYRIEHFGGYRRVPGSMARTRATIEACHVAGGHTHHFSRSFTENGRHQAIDLGHGTREETRMYKQVNGTTHHPKWIAGFWMVRNGCAYPFPIEFTDWSFWLREISVRKKEVS
jgi:hypothetical protein